MSHSSKLFIHQLPVFTNSFLLLTILWIYRWDKCSSRPTTSLHILHDIHAHNQEFLSFLGHRNQPESRDIKILKKKGKAKKCSSTGKHSKELIAHNWIIIMHYKSKTT